LMDGLVLILPIHHFMNRAETLAALKGLALDVLGPAALEQLGPKQ
jgi:hypothetical protein